MTRGPTLIILLVLLTHSLFAQTDSVKYTRDFIFKEGIYITIDDFKNNNPPLTPDNFKKYNPELDYLDETFFENKGVIGIARRKIFYPDSIGNVREKTIDSLFGYSVDNYLFINRHSISGIGFRSVRIFRLGSISYCFDVSPNSRARGGPLGLVKTKKIKHNPYLPSTEHYVIGNTNVPQFLFSYGTGKIYDYNSLNFLPLLQNIDSELYAEYIKLSDSEKEKKLFLYLNKVNEKHPIYFKN